MWRRLTSRGGRWAVIGTAAAATAFLAMPSAAPASATPPPYLALGDSVVYGYITSDGYAYVNPQNFVAYPQYVADALHMSVTNAACPGEATGGFLSTTGTDNGCRPFKSTFPLHVSYGGAATQMAFADTFLHAHPATQLVTIGIGANDGFVLEKQCTISSGGDPTLFGECLQANLPGLLGTVAQNIATIVHNLRTLGNYHGRVILVNYYSTDYSDQTPTGATALSVALNDAISNAAQLANVQVADAFTLFGQVAGQAAGGKTCQAGLLNVDPTHSAFPSALCDVHPSQSGQQLLAQAVENAWTQPIK